MTGLSLLLLFYSFIIILFVYIWFCADVDSPGLNGIASRFFVHKVPKTLSALVTSICGTKVSGCCFSIYNYVVHERNPILVIAYLLIINAAFITWLFFGVPLLPPNHPMSDFHYAFAYVGVVVSQLTFYLACTKSPGVINMESVHVFNHQPCDGLMFQSKMFCTTCRVPKLARSKHCSLCGYCVPVFDHHCVWVNQCVGELNYRYFLLFLFTNSAFFYYATYVLAWILLVQIDRQRLFSLTFIDRDTGTEYAATFWIVLQYVLVRYTSIVVLLLLAVVMGTAVFLFFGYHIYLVAIGSTTNESVKLDYYKRMYGQIKKQYHLYLQLKEEKKNAKKVEEKETEKICNSVKSEASISEIGNDRNLEKEQKDRKEGAGDDELEKKITKPPKLPEGFRFNEASDYQVHPLRIILDRIDEMEEQHQKSPNASSESNYLSEKELQKLFEGNSNTVTNYYNHGFRSNMRRIIFPPSLYENSRHSGNFNEKQGVSKKLKKK